MKKTSVTVLLAAFLAAGATAFDAAAQTDAQTGGTGILEVEEAYGVSATAETPSATAESADNNSPAQPTGNTASPDDNELNVDETITAEEYSEE